jgi:DNA-binding transcriptional LysR family regulator
MESMQSGDLYAGLSLQRLQVFVAVADHAGFSAAADYLAIGQPTVSFHIKALERLLGAKLLVYRERRVHLTAEGEALYRVASDMLRQTERVAVTIRNIRDGRAGELRIGASIAFELPAFFHLVVAPFQRAHPGLHLSVEFGHSVRLAECVHDKQLDLAYVVNWRLPAGARYTALHGGSFVLMVAPEHPLASKHVVTGDDVFEAGLITAPTFSQEWPHYEHLLRAAGVERYRVGLQIDGVQARLAATQAGLGVMGVFVPPYAAQDLYKLLRPLRLPFSPPQLEFGLVLPPEHLQVPAAQHFSEWLRRVSAPLGATASRPRLAGSAGTPRVAGGGG